MLTALVRRALPLTGCRSMMMQAWKVTESTSSLPENLSNYDLQGNEYDTKLGLQDCRIPTIACAGDVLVKVHASSVNPIDLKMCNGYGRKVLDWMYWMGDFGPKVSCDRHPLLLGRDFSGEVVAVGNSSNNIKVGDLVYGVVEPHKQGSHAQYVISPQYCMYRKPNNLSHIEAASIPYAALTAWSALCTFGQLNSNNCQGKRVFIQGGSGGVGSFSIQLLKAWGAHVTATCSEDNMQWLESTLMVDHVICYDDIVELQNLKSSFDFILDAGKYNEELQSRDQVVEMSTEYLKPFKGSIYVTLSSPVLDNTDKYGLIFGTAKSGLEALSDTFKGLSNLRSVRWAFFVPNRNALSEITNMIESNVIKPVVHNQVFRFEELPKAYNQSETGISQGKIVIDHTTNHNDR